jgi:hypothetical protein
VTITSTGYTGTVNEVQWSKLSALVGQRWNVADDTSFAVSISNTHGDRGVDVAAGTAFGDGVMDVNSATIPLNAGTLGSGTRWDTVVVHRKWGVGAASDVTIRAGTSSQTPTLTYTSPGVECDQPLALIKIVSGQTAIQQVIDLRSPGFKFLATTTAPAISIPTPTVNQVAFALDTGHQWQAQRIGGTPTWVDLDAVSWQSLSLANGLAAVDTTPQFTKVHDLVTLRGSVGSGGPSPIMIYTGSADLTLATLPAGYRPASGRRFLLPAGPPLDSSFVASTARCSVDATGVVRLYADGKTILHVYLDQIQFYAEA